MASTNAFASVRFYYPPGDKRLSHCRVIRFDIASGKILEHWTDPMVDATPFTWDPLGKRLFYAGSRRGQSEDVIEVLDKPGGKPRFLACGSGPVFPSPHGDFAAIMVSATELQIIRLKSGNVLFTTGNASGVAWQTEHTFRYTRSYQAWPGPRYEDVPFTFDVRTRRAEKLTPSTQTASKAKFQLENDFEGDDAYSYIVDAAGRRTRLTGDERWRNRWNGNVIQGLQLGERLPDGHYEVHTYAHRSCNQIVGKLDVEKAEISYWFTTPGDYRKLANTGWLLGWPLRRFTKHGSIVIMESPLDRARIDNPEKWERIWSDAHHAGNAVQLA